MNCPMPAPRYDTITLAPGGGGTLTASLIHEIFLPRSARIPPRPASLEKSALFSCALMQFEHESPCETRFSLPACMNGFGISHLASCQPGIK